MKWFILIICLGYAFANEKLLGELEEILAKQKDSPEKTNDDQVDKLMDDILEYLEQDDKYDPKPEDKISSLYDDALFQEDEPLVKRLIRRAKYGYCMDGRTLAEGPNDRGCSRALCYDEQVGTCNRIFARELKLKNFAESKRLIKAKCTRNYMRMRDLCPNTCQYCKPRSPAMNCLARYRKKSSLIKYGCCSMVGIPALREDKKDCMPCRDIYRHACDQFMKRRFGLNCNTNSYRIRTFLERKCAVSCGICKFGEL